MMSRAFATNGSSNGFAGTHMSTGVLGSGNGTIMGSIGLNQIMTAVAGSSTTTVVPGQGIGAMMNGLAAGNGTDIGTIMSSFWQHLPANGSADATTPAAGSSLGLGMMSGIAGNSGLDIGSMMNGLFHGALNGTTDASATVSSVPQTILDNMPGINLVGMPHMNLDFLSSGQ